jgi:serine/threonine protein kinase/formylglycine-generating enzyme required for sulfatase activity
MSELYPDHGEALGVDALQRVVAACDQFEAAWRSGLPPRLEPYLRGVEPAERDRLFRELLAIEIELRLKRGQAPTLAEYQKRYPDWAEVAALVFAQDLGRDSDVRDGGSGAGATANLVPATEPGPDASLTLGEATVLEDGPTQKAQTGPEEPIPESLGRYTVIRLLGRGGFGRVYLARDFELGRFVAIKVPRPGLLRSPEQVESILSEARLAAALRHPAIVAVHDVGRFGEHGVFVVFEYVEGTNLADVLNSERLSPTQLVKFMIPVADAIHHAHRAGMVHRDLKPSNILIDEQRKPHIADFGLAVHEDLHDLRTGEIAGTPVFMAPEQVQGETHRLDGRTDVWALGVILYFGLMGRPPFSGRNRAELFDEILHRDPKPPRQYSDVISRELERICLKCLSKRMADRHETAADLADDLKSWLIAEASTESSATTTTPFQQTAAASRPARIIPKGLRAFDIEDADFFLTLVPGPVDRDGLPESIRAWKRRLEERDPARSYPVSLLYGPSGSGKSSLVKAGLLPRLASSVRPIYVEASPSGTEARLLAALEREVPGLSAIRRLDEATAAIRAGKAIPKGRKVLVVLDQFEQWLHSHPEESAGELVRALRHCDGVRIQALLLVRDDFWMAITRFLRELEVRLVEGVNSAAVELFDGPHAKRVLAELGCALSALPGNAGTGTGLEADKERFLDTAVEELAGKDGRVIPVRLTLFAEMLRHREWSTATLRSLGGIEGIGVTFLDETFSAPTAPPAHRVHAAAAQAVLKALLPDPASDLKGGVARSSVLQRAAGYADRPADFAELIHILDNELRMVTPVDTKAVELETGDAGSPEEARYQLTHDYLVPPLRQWLFRKQNETRRGRAALELATLSALWRNRPGPRRIPTLLEWLKIVCFTQRRRWSPDERRMMSAAARHYLVRAAAAIAIAATIGWGLYVNRRHERAQAALGQALNASYQKLAEFVPEIAANSHLVRRNLEDLEKSESPLTHDRDVVEILLYRDRPTEKRAAYLRARLLAAQIDEVEVIRDALAAHPAQAGKDELNGVLLDASAEPGARLRAACGLVALDPSTAGSWQAVAPALCEALVAEKQKAVTTWLELIEPAAGILVAPLGEVCRDAKRDSTTQSTAAMTLAEILKRRSQPDVLTRMAVAALPEPFRILLRELVSLGPSEPVLQLLRDVLLERAVDTETETGKDELAGRHAAAGIALAALGKPESFWPLLRHKTDPRLRSLLVQRLAANLLPPRLLVDRLALADVDPIERQALLLAFAEAPAPDVATPVESVLLERARRLYLEDPHPGVHSAAELLIRRWGSAELFARFQESLTTGATGKDGLGWERAPGGHTLVILTGPLEFRMGAPPSEQAHYGNPILHHRKIDRSLAVATKEVTLEQFRQFDPSHRHEPRYGDAPSCAAIHIPWFAAARYCNWLSQQAGIDSSQWCYPEPVEPGIFLSEDAVKRTGFRLPTEAEWEYFCRAGTETSRPYGSSQDLLSHYAWTWLNSDNQIHPPGQLLPNELGLFDILGNAWEWCHDGPVGHYRSQVTDFPAYPRGTKEHPSPDALPSETVDATDRARETWRLLRGGSYSYAPDRARSAFRDWQPSSDNREYLGFRVVRTLPAGDR